MDLSTDAEKEALSKKNEENKDLLDKMKNILGDKVKAVKLTDKLGSHPVCISADGYVSLEMAKVLSQMPNGGNGIKADLVLEINSEHPIAKKLTEADDETLAKYTKILYAQAKLIAGLDIDNPTELTDSIVDLM